MNRFLLFAFMITIGASSLIAQPSLDSRKQSILQKLQSDDYFTKLNAISDLTYDTNVPEAVPILEKIFWQQDRRTMLRILRALSKYKSPNCIKLAHQCLNGLDTIKSHSHFSGNDLLECQVDITNSLFEMGDYSTYKYVFEMVEREKPKVFSLASKLLGAILLNLPSEEKRAKEELVRIVELNSPDESPEALRYLEEKYGESALMLIEYAISHSTKGIIKRNALGLIKKYPSDEVEKFLKERFLEDTAAVDDIAEELIRDYNKPLTYKFVLDNLYQTHADSTAKEQVKMDVMNPPMQFDTSMTALQLMQTLSPIVDTCYAYEWIKDSSFAVELKIGIALVIHHIDRGDSLAAAMKIDKILADVGHTFFDSLQKSKRLINPAGWAYLNWGLFFSIEKLYSSKSHIYLLSPDSIDAGSGNFTLEVAGTSFTPSSKVEWNGFAKPTVFVSDTLLRVEISASDVIKPQRNGISVRFKDESYRLSNVIKFTVKENKK